MTYHDLPPDNRDLPLTDPTLRADLIDLIVTLEDREHGCLALLLLDDEDRCLTPVVISHTGPLTPDLVEHACETILGEIVPDGLVVALGCPGRPQPTDGDRACHQMVLDVCADKGIRLLGTYVASGEDQVVELPTLERLAS